MPVISIDRACLAYGHVALLDHAAMQIDAGERIGLIGRNGSGKSSLLKALAGLGSLDDGEVWREPGLSIAYVPQEPEFATHDTVFQAVAAGLGDVARVLAEYHEVTHTVGAGDAATMDRMQELQTQLEANDGWRLNSRIEQAISRLALDGDARVDALSGGGKKRVALARALVAEPQLLLLDEPTNHLDVDGILWLEDLLRGYQGAIMVITHDRVFLDAVATRIIELDRGKLVSFPGRFAEYQQRKEFMLNEEALANARADKMLAQEEIWIRKGVEARRTRSVGRVQRLEQLRAARAARREQLGKVDFQLVRGDASGKLVAELENVNKRFGEKIVVRDFSCRILRGDKVGLIGANGTGKTTLLRLILGQLAADSGELRLGSKIEVAYFDQFRTQLDPEAPLREVISPGSDYVEIGGARKHVIGYLEDFLFAPERARSPVKSLSGGERNRLLLARLFARPANVLVLDEPTNDLDIETLELLEALLQDYSGTVFLVSHDRAFLDNVVTQTIASEGNGQWKEYVGGYSDWLRQRPAGGAARFDATGGADAKPASRVGAGDTAKAKPAGRKKLSFKEQRELEQLPDRIAALEAEQAVLQNRMTDPVFYQGPPDAVRELQTRLAAIDAEIDAAMIRWETLEAKG
ncbi:MAG: ATP-binding cassette domain-containing protein [Sulfuritalea sp.]|jgi:ATP-binding cassette subfamily F protein uup|nr:ATP-binding cassette domain-containing protein [Sulfuritalea sp.]